MAWHYLQYVIGLARLGHDVYFVEDSDDYPSCYDPRRHVTDSDPTYGLRFTGQVFHKIGLDDRWAYYDAHTGQWFGPCADSILDVCTTADLLLNISGANPLRAWLLNVPVRAFIDTDPVFEQIRQLTVPRRRELALQHTAFFSFGENVVVGRSEIPSDGHRWQATRQPIVLDMWPSTPGPLEGKYTTVMQWDSYSGRDYDGRHYGMKSESFGPYFDLPKRSEATFELALGSPSAPRELFRNKGWSLRDPLAITQNPWTYQHYIQRSKVEFSVAKHGYVVGRSGWFSERSAAYLASGRPVLVQETGFSDWLETGAGVVPFSTPEEALAGVEEIDSHYQFHCQAARAVAEAYFDARNVLLRLIKCAMNSPLHPVVESQEVP